MTDDWPTLIRDHGPLVWRTAWGLLRNHADASDCFQQTFLAAVEWATREPVRNWPAVLRRLATQRALDGLRRRRRPAEFVETADPTAIDPATSAEGDELAARLRRALAEIDPVQAEVFCLVCLDGHTNQEAAEMLNIKPNHARVLLHRARTALRERLAAFDPRREVSR